MKKLVSLLTTLAMAMSMMVTVAHADESDYAYIGFGTNQYGDIKSYYSKGETKQLEIWALDEDGEDVLFEDDAVYASSNENVVTVTSGGLMTAEDYGVATVTATCGTLKASMLVTVTPNKFYQTQDSKENSTAHARTGSKSVSVTVGTLSNAKNSNGSVNTDHYAAATSSYHWPYPVPAKSNMVVEGWFYDSGEAANAEAAIGFKKNEIQSDTGVLGVLVSTDTTYKLSSVNPRWDQVWDSHVSGTAATDTGIPRVKGWHQVTIVESYPGAAGNVTAKAGSDTVGKSLNYELYLDGQLVKSGASEHYTRWQMYGYAGFTEGSTAWFDDGVNLEYMQVNGVTLTTDPEDSEMLVANVDYVGNSGTNATKAYQWYYAASADAASWTPIAGATSASYKPEDLPSGSFVKAGAVVTDTIKDVSYTTNEYFSAPTFVFDGIYNSVSLGKSDSYVTKGGTIDLAVTGFAADGMERVISDRSEMTFQSSNENVATVSQSGTVTAVDYGVSTITLSYNDLSASMLVTVTPKKITESTYESNTTDITRRGVGAQPRIVEHPLPAARDDNNNTVSDHYLARTITVHWPSDPLKSNAVIEGWFYDNGGTVNAEAAIGFKRYQDYSDSGVIGVLHSEDTTYKISSVHGRWDEVWDSDVEGSAVTDTGIARSKGWHQVTLVEANPEGNVVESSKARATLRKIYLDGQLISTYTSKHKVNFIVYGYAGFTEGSVAYFDDGSNLEYMQVNGVTLTADPTDSETLVANVDYLGYSGASAATAYKWYYADSENAANWTEISGATQGSYKPDNSIKGKFIKASAVVTETINNTGSYTSEEYFSDPTYVFDGVYNSISLGKSTSYVTKGGTIDLAVTGYGGDGIERTIIDRAGMTFTSSDEQTATVSANGVVTAVDYGVTTITVNYGLLSAKMLVTVTPGAISTMDASKETATPLARTGSGAAIVTVGTLGQEKSESNAALIPDTVVGAFTTFHWPGMPNKSNMVAEGWFYDNGEAENAESAVGFRRYNDYSNTGAIGVIRSADTTYMISGAGGRWDQIRERDVTNAAVTDTGIARTKGWHQVTIVQGNTEGNVIEKATIGSDQVAKSNRYAIYLDGQLIRSGESKNTTRYQVYGYAGFTEGSVAYFDDGLNAYYVGIQNLAITKNNGVLEAQYDYCGPLSNQTVSYQWYNNAGGAWSAISGATGATYTPGSNMYNTAFKVLVTVTDTVNGATITTDRESNEYFDAETAISYANGNVTVCAGKAITGVLIIAEYETVNGYDRLISRDIMDFTASEGEVKSVPVSITSGKAMLWESLTTQVPYCSACEIR